MKTDSYTATLSPYAALVSERKNLRPVPYTILFRDAPPDSPCWEEFDEASLRPYFERIVSAFLIESARVQDLSVSYSEAEERSMLFMIESLLQVRQMLQE